MANMQFERVPPPSKARVQDRAASLGLVDGLRVEDSAYQYRCNCCNRMQPRNSITVWVPDGVSHRDPDWSVTESCRVSGYNGEWSGWCLSCAPKTGALRILPVGGPVGAGLVIAACMVIAIIGAVLLA